MKEIKKSLAYINPELCKQWHPTKNKDLKPEDVLPNSNKKVWWLYPYDDPKTGKHFNFEWMASISHRNNGRGCPFLSNRALYVGFNDLKTRHPIFAKQFNQQKNNMKPEDVIDGSSKKFWWIYPYDDPKTGKHFDFEWQAKISDRIKGGICPYLSGKKDIWIGYNDLGHTNLELSKEWDYEKNFPLTPEDVTANSNKKVWWLLSYDDPITGKHFDFNWQATICNRNKGAKCPFLPTAKNHKVHKELNSLSLLNPELSKEWNYEKNFPLTPEDVTPNSNKKVWWLYPYDDPKTGKHFDFEWQATICTRNKGIGCPFLSNQKIWKNFNDLKTTNPGLSREWNYKKNYPLKPEDVTADCTRKVWWLYPYDDPITGKHFDFEWMASIHHRNNGIGCPFLSGRYAWKNFNDLKTTNPSLSREWNYKKNYPLKPEDVTPGSNKKVWWIYPYDDPKTGKHFDFEWMASISHRTAGEGCPFLTSSKAEILIYDLLRNNNLQFIAEKFFPKCIDKKMLPFDIFLTNENIIIECDGRQHFEIVNRFGGKEDLKIRKNHDKIKNSFCKDNNIPILRIPYTYDPIADKQKIESLVLDFINTKQVPQEILDFYSQYKFSNYVECAEALNKQNLS